MDRTSGNINPASSIQDPGSAPIGVFDSGIGGLSVLREIRALLPAEDLLYVADTACLPYGSRSIDLIRARSRILTRFLQQQGAKSVVVACNTATAAAVASLRAEFDLPVIGMEPAIKPAAAASRSGVIGVLATAGTLGSEKFAHLVDRFGGHVEVLIQPCPGLVERIESGDLDGPETVALVAAYVDPLIEGGADSIVLGCTHYPFVMPLIHARAGAGVSVIETGSAVARQVKRRLEQAGLLNSGEKHGSERFWTSDDPVRVRKAIERLWEGAVVVEKMPGSEFKVK